MMWMLIVHVVPLAQKINDLFQNAIFWSYVFILKKEPPHPHTSCFLYIFWGNSYPFYQLRVIYFSAKEVLKRSSWPLARNLKSKAKKLIGKYRNNYFSLISYFLLIPVAAPSILLWPNHHPFVSRGYLDSPFLLAQMPIFLCYLFSSALMILIHVSSALSIPHSIF